MDNEITINGIKYVRAASPTGYERVEKRGMYYFNSDDITFGSYEVKAGVDESRYKNGNYNTSRTIAENNARADRLMRNLRQWQALNDKPINWNDKEHAKYYIYYLYAYNKLTFSSCYTYKNCGCVYFSSGEKVKEVIEVFHNELVWYFTKYQDRLDN